jgi:hypothetical protein
MTRFRYSALCTGLLFGVAGCSSSFTQSTPVAPISSDYTAIWQDRGSLYRREVTTSPQSNLQQISVRERQRGALAVLDAFQHYRKTEPVDRAAVSWLRTRHAAHRARLLETGLEIDRLVELVDEPRKLESVTLEGDALKSLAYNVGSVTEIRLIYRELRKAITGDMRPTVEDKRSVGSSANYDAISRGLMSGMGALFGR